nr:hypothetical protein [Bird parvovirus]
MLAYDNYEFMYKQAFEKLRNWWFNHSVHLKLCAETETLEGDEEFHLAFNTLQLKLNSSEEARKILGDLKSKGETESIALDCMLNECIRWAICNTRGGMEWCMDTALSIADRTISRHEYQIPFSDDETQN